MQKHILVVSFLPPAPGTGTPIILRRHLQRLEQKGWKITIAVPELRLRAADHIPASWQVIPLSSRRWWWPPLREQIPGLLNIRLPFWQLECEKLLGKERPTAILAFLCEIYPMLAVHLSKSWNIPLSVIIHDQEECWAESKAERDLIRHRAAHILSHASRVWPVSRELGEIYQLKEPEKLSVLFPLSEQISCEFVEWKSHFQANPVVAHAGRLHSFQLPNLKSLAQALQKVDGTLLLIASSDDPTLLQLLETHSNVKWHEPFEHNSDVIEFLGKNATCILVSYSFSLVEQPWATTSFPSKLVEFSHLGLPVLILAPPFAAASKWAKQQQWLCHIDQLNEFTISEAVMKLVNKDDWLKMAEQTRRAALTEFCPDQIQSQFESELAVK